MSRREPVQARVFIWAYAGVEDTEQTLGWLEKASAERSGEMVTLKVNPIYDFLRGDPRFQRLVERVGLGTVGFLTSASEPTPCSCWRSCFRPHHCRAPAASRSAWLPTPPWSSATRSSGVGYANFDFLITNGAGRVRRSSWPPSS